MHYHKEKRVRDFVSVVVKSRMQGNRPKNIVCTDNHKFFSEGKWIEAKDLVPGQKIHHLAENISETAKQVILGSLLGDSSIYSTSNKSLGFSFSHTNHKYFQYKKEVLGCLLNECKGTVGGYEGSKRNRRGNSIVNASITDLLSICCVNGKKTVNKEWINLLSPLALAFWYMDDGSCVFTEKQAPRAKIATNGFTKEKADLLQEMLYSKYGVECEVFDYKGPTICMSKMGTEKFFSVIAPYICDCMKYKIHPKYKNMPCVLPFEKSTFTGTLETEVIKVTKDMPVRAKSASRYQYDLTIKKNSNYFTGRILVHNTNSRIVLMPDGKFLIGSRKEFLCCGDDVIYNQSLGIVDIMRDTAEKITRKIDLPDCISVFFFESYGKGINSKAYSTKSTSHRMFDVATITEKQFNEMMEWPIGNISAWRENGGQNFYSIDGQKCIAESLSIERVPDLLEVGVDFMPKTLTNALKFLEDNIPSTQAAIDDSGKGDPEGIVFRSSDRRVIAKARYEDYKRTFKKQKQGK